jgi:membrane protein implicated in regulation of membrane protease activity
MAAFLFLLVLAAITGVLGAVLKTVLLVIVAIVAATVLAGWLAWRSFRRSVLRAQHADALGTGGTTTTITIGRAQRDAGGERPPTTHDDRY